MLDKITTQNILSLGVSLAFVLLVWIWMVHPPTGDKDTLALLNALVMVVGSAFLAVINYHFGSSSGSKDKDTANKDLLQQVTTALTNGTVPKAEPEATDALRPGGK